MYDVVTSMYVKLAEIISLTKLSTLHRFCNLLMEVDCMNIYYLVDIPQNLIHDERFNNKYSTIVVTIKI